MKISRAQGANLAGGILVVAGAALIWRAVPFWRALASPFWRVVVPLLGAALGLAKGVFVLRRTIARMVARLETLPDRFWVWQTYPAYFYPLLAVMISSGVAVRLWLGESAPGFVAGLYFGIGVALLSATGPYFRGARSFAATSGSVAPAPQPASNALGSDSTRRASAAARSPNQSEIAGPS